MHAWPVLHKVSKSSFCIVSCQIMWGTPLSLNQTKPWHVSCLAILQALSQNHDSYNHTLGSKKERKEEKFPIKEKAKKGRKGNSQSKSGRKRKKKKREIPNQRVGEKRKKILTKDEEEENTMRSKDEGNIRREVFGPNNIRTIRNCLPSERKEKGNHEPKMVFSFDYQPKLVR